MPRLFPPSFERRWLALLATAVVGLLLAACSGGKAPDQTATGETSTAQPTLAATNDGGNGDGGSTTGGMPGAVDSATTRDAVLVEVGYQPPDDHVPSTGAYLPANGKPTLVFVDAIW